jgi:TolB-like protein/DNA-binding winged helix-turn-helix (wHTH) protein
VKQVNPQQDVIRFGVFEADLRTGELRRKGRQLRLQEQPFQVLLLLLARPGELVTREELRQKLWPADTFVDFEHGLNKAISKLRDALGDDRETPLYIQTLPRRGYRFIAPVSANPVPASRESEATPATRPGPSITGSPSRPRWMTLEPVLLLASLALLVSMFGYRLVRKQPRSPATALAAPIRSLAVLPLQNLSGDKDQEYFADGMTDELITDLGQMSALRVISRTSVMHYKQSSETLPPLPQIGRELGADAIVEGTVFRSGNRVRITAQLIDARTDRHLWAHSYERDLGDVIALQDEVARDIADEVRVKLTPQERARLAAPHPVNPEAHEAYLKGRFYWNLFTEAGAKKSIGFFQQALEKDPNYALGYSGMADYYAVMYVRYGDLSYNEACPKAEAFALKAVHLDDSLAEGHHSLAAIRFYCDWDSSGAESEFKRAIQLNSSYAETHRVYSDLLSRQGRTAEVLVEMKRMVENDPMSARCNQLLGWDYYMMRDYDRAILQERKALEIDPTRGDAHYVLGFVYTQTGQYDLAVREFTLAGADPGTSPSVGYVYALGGKRKQALEVLRRLNAMSTTRPVSAVDRALVHIGLGDKNRAIALLLKAYREHDSGLLSLKVDPRFDSLRPDPRFQDLVRRIGL